MWSSGLAILSVVMYLMRDSLLSTMQGPPLSILGWEHQSVLTLWLSTRQPLVSTKYSQINYFFLLEFLYLISISVSKIHFYH